MKPRVVFDCMVFLQGAARATSPARACFQLVEEDRVILFVSAEILTEVRDVLTRPKLQRRFPSLSPAWAESFVQNVEIKAVAITDIPKAMALERDPEDEPYLNLAIGVDAGYLVSRDFDLLDLMNDQEFRERFPKLKIVDPATFLEEMRRLEGT